MIRRLALFCALAVIPTTLLAKEVFLAIAGSVGVFRSDVRIFNPSQTKDIRIQAYYLPVGNISNTTVQPIAITVPKRQMLVYNDAVLSLFHSSGLGGIRLSSSDEFVATERIYATSTTACSGAVNPCTLGQFLNGVDSGSAQRNGVILQLNSPSGSAPANRTNIGAQNPNNTTATVVWRVYDKNNALVGTAKTIPMPPYAVISPSDIRIFGASIPTSADLSETWVSFTSDQPILAYASVVDNGSTDQTYIPAAVDTDPLPTTIPLGLNLTGTFSGTDSDGTMSLVLTQTGSSLSGHGSASLPYPYPKLDFIVTGTVNGPTVTLAMQSNGGCYYDCLAESVMSATNGTIEGSFSAPLVCTGNYAGEHFVVTRQDVTPTVLTNGQTLSNLSVLTGEWAYFKITVPAGEGNLTITSAGGTGDVDMYVKRGVQPTDSFYDYRSDRPGNNESVSISADILDTTDILAGDWYISLHGYAAVAGVSLNATVRCCAPVF
jgi:hypothetical protein